MANQPQPKEDPKAASSCPDNPSLAATGEFPHSPQQEGKGEGVGESPSKSKKAAKSK